MDSCGHQSKPWWRNALSTDTAPPTPSHTRSCHRHRTPRGSHVIRPGGELIERAPLLEEHLLVTEIDLRDSDRLRWRLPLLDDERFDIQGPTEGPLR